MEELCSWQAHSSLQHVGPGEFQKNCKWGEREYFFAFGGGHQSLF